MLEKSFSFRARGTPVIGLRSEPYDGGLEICALSSVVFARARERQGKLFSAKTGPMAVLSRAGVDS